MKPKKTPKYKMLHNRLSLALHIAEHLTEEERTHAEAMLSKRTEARMWINNYKYKQTQAAQSGGYSQKFWDAHEKWNTSDAALRGLRAVARLRYGNSLTAGLYRCTNKHTYGRKKIGMHGRYRGSYIKKDALLMWIERDEFGENWFIDLSDNRTIVALRGTALKAIIPVPPETEEPK